MRLLRVISLLISVGVFTAGCAAALVGCAGTQVKQSSKTWAINVATGKEYLASKEVTKGKTGAVASKLDVGGLATYVEVDADGSYIVDLSGDSTGADAAVLSQMAVALAQEFTGLLPEAQLAGVVAAMKSGGFPDSIVVTLREALMGRGALEDL